MYVFNVRLVLNVIYFKLISCLLQKFYQGGLRVPFYGNEDSITLIPIKLDSNTFLGNIYLYKNKIKDYFCF